MRLTTHPFATLGAAPAWAPLDEGLILRLRESLSMLGKAEPSLARRFFDLLFRRHPELHRLFPADLSGEESKLTEALGWVVANLGDPAAVQAALRKLGEGHRDFGVRAEHHPAFAGSLIDAMRQAMAAGGVGLTGGGGWTPELEADWTVAMAMVSRHMLSATCNGRARQPAR